MTALYAASREALAEAYYNWHDGEGGREPELSDFLIDSGVVQVIDPDDDELVNKVHQAYWHLENATPMDAARNVLRALVEDQP